MTRRPATPLTGASLEQLYLKHEMNLYNIACRYVRDAQEAQDIVQEVFVRLWQKRAHLHADGLEGYLYRATFNLSVNRYRWRKIRQFLPLEEEEQADDPGLGEQLDRKRKACALERALGRLPHKLKQVIILSDVLGHPPAEVAQLLGIPAGTVGSRRNKALKILRQRYGKSLGAIDD